MGLVHISDFENDQVGSMCNTPFANVVTFKPQQSSSPTVLLDMYICTVYPLVYILVNSLQLSVCFNRVF